MREFLLFRLYGPLAAWGEIAVGEVRPTALSPSRSALLGLVAAALGLRRAEEEAHRRLADELRFAVRVRAAGLPLADYHTVQSAPRRKGAIHATRADQLRAPRDQRPTLVTRRDHRCDALYEVAAWNVEPVDHPLESLRQALHRPRFTLYLGRKACPPALPLEPQVVSAESLVAAFRAARFEQQPELLQVLSAEGPGSLVWEDDPEGVAGIPAHEERVRRDQPLSRERFLFRNRREHYAPFPTQEVAP